MATGLLHLISSLDQSEREVWIYGSLPGMDRIIERLIEDERRPTTEEASSSPAPE